MKQPTYMRQRYLLSFVGQLGVGGVSCTNLQKLIFLNEQNSGVFYYDFIPYKYGPYSFQLERDINVLCSASYLRVSGRRLYLEDSSLVAGTLFIALERGKALLKRTYREYPYYAINSAILRKLFSDGEAERILHSGMPVRSNKSVLFTIGYEGLSIEAFINTLIRNNVRLLCDVRKNPVSRKFGFSKSQLERILPKIKIKYINIPELGIASEKRASLNARSDYEDLFSDYRDTISDRMFYLKEVYKLMLKRNRIALMCYEKNPEMCHRNIIRNCLVEMYGMESVDL